MLSKREVVIDAELIELRDELKKLQAQARGKILSLETMSKTSEVNLLKKSSMAGMTQSELKIGSFDKIKDLEARKEAMRQEIKILKAKISSKRSSGKYLRERVGAKGHANATRFFEDIDKEIAKTIRANYEAETFFDYIDFYYSQPVETRDADLKEMVEHPF